MSSTTTWTALLSGPDRPGIVSGVSQWIHQEGGNILHADQHRDFEENLFFQRLEWEVAECDPTELEERFVSMAHELGMTRVTLRPASRRFRIGLLVSRLDHCFWDILLRERAGEFRGDIVCCVSNHTTAAPVAEYFGKPFHHVPVRADQKSEAEQRLWEICQENQVDLLVMARYMQILSGDFLRKFDRPVINIHHSFLPAFAGAKPYHQAYQRGVKLIGATAHYATEILDDGPIIAQEVDSVTHRNNVEDLVRKGRDLEKRVLAKALRFHLDQRVLVYQAKTVVFD